MDPSSRRRIGKTSLPLLSACIGLSLIAAASLGQAPPAGQPGERKPGKAERQPSILEGRVLDKASGRPLAKVIVAVADAEGGRISWDGERYVSISAPGENVLLFCRVYSSKRADKTETDEQGRFNIKGLAHGRYNLVAIDPAAGLTRVENIEFTRKSKPLEIILEPFAEFAKVTLKGRVLDSEGKLVADAAVAVADAISGRIHCDVTNTLHALVEDGSEASWFRSSAADGRTGTATTDAKGKFTISSLKTGPYHLAASHPEKGLALIEELELNGEGGDSEVTLKPLPARQLVSLKGRVVDHRHNPVADAKVGIADATDGQLAADNQGYFAAWCTGKQDTESSWFTKSQDNTRAGQTTTNDEGEFTFPDKIPGSYNLIAVRDGKGAAVVQDLAISKDDRPLDVALNAPAYIDGKIAGMSVARLMVEQLCCRLSPAGLPKNVTFNYMIAIKAGERFHVGPLPRADQWVLSLDQYIETQGYSATLLRAPVRAAPGETSLLELNLTQGSTFSGEVRGPRGEALRSVSVVATAADDSDRAYGAVTKADGKYAIRGLPDGDYTLEVKRHARRTAPG